MDTQDTTSPADSPVLSGEPSVCYFRLPQLLGSWVSNVWPHLSLPDSAVPA